MYAETKRIQHWFCLCHLRTNIVCRLQLLFCILNSVGHPPTCSDHDIHVHFTSNRGAMFSQDCSPEQSVSGSSSSGAANFPIHISDRLQRTHSLHSTVWSLLMMHASTRHLNLSKINPLLPPAPDALVLILPANQDCPRLSCFWLHLVRTNTPCQEIASFVRPH